MPIDKIDLHLDVDLIFACSMKDIKKKCSDTARGNIGRNRNENNITEKRIFPGYRWKKYRSEILIS